MWSEASDQIGKRRKNRDKAWNFLQECDIYVVREFPLSGEKRVE
jgi:hypothetical protein